MDIKKYFLPIVIAAISVAFIAISLICWFNNGRSAKIVNAKMKIGALLLTLTAIISGCSKGTDGNDPTIMCYDLPAVNVVLIDSIKNDTVSIESTTSQTISGLIFGREAPKYEWKLSNTSNSLLASKPLLPLDGKFDTDSEKFSITFDPKLAAGNYIMQIFAVQSETDKKICSQFLISIKD